MQDEKGDKPKRLRSRRNERASAASGSMRKACCKIFAACMMAVPFQMAHAVIETDPADYVPLPPGTNLAVLYYQHAFRDSTYHGGEQVNIPFRLETDIAIARYVRYLSVAGFTVDVQAIVPFGSVRLSQPVSSVSNGAGDPFLGTVIWLLNDQKAQRYLALGAFLGIPVGSYDSAKGAVNVGSNRWQGVFQISYGQPIYGNLAFDVTGEYAIYGANNDFAGLKYQQKPTYELQTHLRYALTPLTTFGVSFYQTAGGRSTLGGVDQADRINTSRYLLTIQQIIVSPTLQLEAQFGQDIHVSSGPKEKYRVNLRLVKVF
ncbi:transporter [Paraburkholderia phytofirmans]|nr:transporter [Paraburkholderia phytofirmans]